MEAIKLCRLDTPIIFIEARINLSRFVVTGCAAKTSATVTFPSLNLISLFAFCFNIWLNGVARSEERRVGKECVSRARSLHEPYKCYSLVRSDGCDRVHNQAF